MTNRIYGKKNLQFRRSRLIMRMRERELSIRGAGKMSKIKELLKQDKKLGRERAKLDKVIARYPDGMTIDGYDTDIGKNGESFPVFTIREDPTIYFGGGGDLKKLESRMLAIHGGDLTAINEELALEPLAVKIEKVDTKSGNQYTTVKLLEDEDNGK